MVCFRNVIVNTLHIGDNKDDDDDDDNNNNHHHHKHQGLGHLACSVSRVTSVLANVSLVSRLFSFLVDCSGMF